MQAMTKDTIREDRKIKRFDEVTNQAQQPHSSAAASEEAVAASEAQAAMAHRQRAPPRSFATKLAFDPLKGPLRYVTLLDMCVSSTHVKTPSDRQTDRHPDIQTDILSCSLKDLQNLTNHTSHCITLHDIAVQHMTSRYIMLPYLTSHALHHITSHHITPQHIAARWITLQ